MSTLERLLMCIRELHRIGYGNSAEAALLKEAYDEITRLRRRQAALIEVLTRRQLEEQAEDIAEIDPEDCAGRGPH